MSAFATLAVVGGVVAVMLGLFRWLEKRRRAPVEALAEGIERWAAGDFEQRLAEDASDVTLRRMARSLNRMASVAQKQIGALQAESSYVQAVVDSMAEGVLVTDDSGTARIANPAFRRQFAFAGRAQGRKPLELTHQPRLARLVEATLESGEAQVEELDLDTTPPQLLVMVGSPLSDGAGSVVVTRDVTDLVRINRMRRDFVANVSHELKTPLTAIRGFAETLRDGAIEDAATAGRFLDRILGQSVRLQALLDDLLTLSRLESPEATAEREAVDMVELVHTGLEEVQPLAEQKGIEVASELAPDCAIPGEQESLERMVRNLLENAVRYNRHGGRVGVRLARSDGELLLEIEDSGVGIPSADLSRVFERFYRVDQARSREEGGTGLGLAIVKHAAQLHGGSVDVESVLGQGSVFRVRLPLPAAAATPIASSQ